MSEVNVPKLRFREFEGEWEKYIFKNIVKLQRGSSPRPIVKYITNADDGVNWIKIGDTINGTNYIDNTEQKITKEGAKKSRKVSIGDIILSNSMSYGKPFILNIDGYIHDGWFVIREYENYFHKAYLLQVLGSEQIQRQYKRLAAGGVVNNISSELVNSVKINLPQKPEQQKIANFLTSIDQKIEQLTKKEKLLVAYKKGVMQKIFSQEIRFRDENGEVYGDWVERKFKNVTYNVSKKNKQNIPFPIYSINNKEGFVPQSTQFDGVDSNDRGYDISLYKIVQEKTFAYNPARINVGSIGYSGNLNNIIISSLYVCFKTNEDINDIFLTQYLTTYSFTKDVLRNVEGGVREYLFYANFSNIKINLPPLAEQTKIANFLSSIDKKIEQVNRQIEESKGFKKGLLQGMFV